MLPEMTTCMFTFAGPLETGAVYTAAASYSDFLLP